MKKTKPDLSANGYKGKKEPVSNQPKNNHNA